MRIDYVFRAKLMPKDLPSLLSNTHSEVLGLLGPIIITQPNFVIAGARNLHVLPNRGARLVGARGDGIPLALSTLRPFRRNPRAVDSPTGRFRRRQFKPGRIRDGLV